VTAINGMKRHLKEYHENVEKVYECTVKDCKMKSASHDIMTGHLSINHGRMMCTWDGCEKVTAESTMYRHVAAKHGKGRRYECTLCEPEPSTHPTSRRLVNHLDTVHWELPKTIKCNHCGKMFRVPDRLTDHVYRMHRPPPSEADAWSCSICKKNYRSSQDLQTHKRKVHTGRVKTCAVCEKSFGVTSNYNRHMKNSHRQSVAIK